MPFDSKPEEVEVLDPKVEILKRMEAFLLNGWCKTSYLGNKNSTCIVGALAKATHTPVILPNNKPHLDPLAFMVEQFLIASLPTIHTRLESYNDDPMTTQGDILKLVRKAIVALS